MGKMRRCSGRILTGAMSAAMILGGYGGTGFFAHAETTEESGLESDVDGEQGRLRKKVDCRLIMVAGNNDYDPDMDRVKIIDIGKYKAVVTHGHRYHLYSGYDPLFYLATENHADYVFFGHTHVPVIHEEGPVTLINPGSLTYPRQHGRQPSYIVGTVEPGKKPEFEIRYI